MECVHKVLAYSHLEDFPYLFQKWAFVYERLIESNKASRLLLFSQSALLHRSVMQTIQFLQSESFSGM